MANMIHVGHMVNMNHVDQQKAKFVRLSFYMCRCLNDMNLDNIGTVIGSRLENIEYLSLNFHSARSCTVYGIHQLINGISGKGNTFKSLRIKMRKHRCLSNESARYPLEELECV